MHKTKKKTKSPKIPQPIKVKKEKTEEDRAPQPMSHYIDDRLELVKQIFGSLKPKTIINLAPEFLKKKDMDEIEELCLNELLCISTKRLLSIINASKCPTDTESDNDSDVEHKEEHVSLEEISSDSEIEGASSSRAKKKKRSGDAFADAKKIATKNSAEKDAKDGQMSVLELLELQARARAIRSQLALEPVTKIEVDSNDSDNDKDSQNSTKDLKSGRRERKRKSSEMERSDKSRNTSNAGTSKQSHSKSNGSTEPSTSNANSEKESVKRLGKKIKLKRNYSASVQEKYEIETGFAGVRRESIAEAPTTSKELKNEVAAAPSRSPSPDVIPIVAETETLLISDSSDMEDQEASTKPVDKNSLVVKINASRGRQVTKPSESEKPQSERSVMTEESPSGKQLQTEQTQSDNRKEEVKRSRKITEPEEGELSESEANDKSDATTDMNSTNEDAVKDATDVVILNEQMEGVADVNIVNRDDKSVKDKTISEETIDNSTTKPMATSDKNDSSSSSSASESENETEATVTPQPTAKTIEIISNVVIGETSAIPADRAITSTTLEEYDDQNDDVISLEGGDLETEMIKQLEADKKADAEKKTATNVEPQDEDIISLDSSEDERSQSWQSRYLKSSKVNKVLLTSRLGKRVRDNIKKSKRSKKESARKTSANGDEESATTSKSSGTSVFTSQHEDGSVEQYKELLEMRHRKTKE